MKCDEAIRYQWTLSVKLSAGYSNVSTPPSSPLYIPPQQA